MLRIIKIIVWFFVLNFGVCNQIWTTPISYWWLIEIMVLFISLILTTESQKR